MRAFLDYMRSYNGQTKGALERLDIVDQLIDQRLDRCASYPRHMRRQDDVRQIKQTHEWTIVCGSSVMTTSKPGPLIWPVFKANSARARQRAGGNSAVEIMLRAEGI
jgi:hypothetical protein